MPREIRPKKPKQHGISPSADPEGERVAGEAGTEATFANRSGEYRVIFRAMRVPGFPACAEIGGVKIYQVKGPVWTQRTEIRQNPGWRPIYDKKMRRLPVGDGEDLTICTLRVQLDADLSSQDLERWNFQVQAATAILVAMLDERIAQELLGEDLIIFDQSGAVETAADHAMRVREYPPTSRVLASQRRALRSLATLDLSRPDPTHAASRWYLRGAQEGPTPDAVVAFWIALEALAKPRYGTKVPRAVRRRSDVGWVESAIEEAGITASDLEPSIGRLAGLRAEIVHGGVEQPVLLREGFYALEGLTRQLIRHRLEIRSSWPAKPENSNLRGPLRRLAGELQHRYRKTRWNSIES